MTLLRDYSLLLLQLSSSPNLVWVHEGSCDRTFLTWVYSFPRDAKEFVMSVNLIIISEIVLFSILKSSNLWIRTEILDYLTLFVPSCVTYSMCHIWFVDVAVDTRLNSSLRHRITHSSLLHQGSHSSFDHHSKRCVGCRLGVRCFYYVPKFVVERLQVELHSTFNSCSSIHRIVVDIV